MLILIPVSFFREYTFWGLTVGFFLKLVLRIIFMSLNPIWTSSTTNVIIFAIGILCAVDRASFVLNLDHESTINQTEERAKSPALLQWVTVAFGAGAWLFFAQWLFAEVSVVSRYTGSEFPATCLMPVPGG